MFMALYDSWGKRSTMGVQESYLSYILKKVIKKILQTTDPYTTILKNRLQKTLDT